MVRLARQQARRIDQLAAKRYHIPPVVLMENAARSAADVACQMLGISPSPGPKGAAGTPGEGGGEGTSASPHVSILCGGGNNGGDGLGIARHLHNRGVCVSVWLTDDPEKYQAEARINFDIIRAMELPIHRADPAVLAAQTPHLWIDAIFGTGLTQPPRDPFTSIVAAVVGSDPVAGGVPVLAIDLPSGLDCDTGLPLGVCLPATRTITFIAEKIGFAFPHARPYLGQVTVGDIGCPVELIEQVLRET